MKLVLTPFVARRGTPLVPGRNETKFGCKAVQLLVAGSKGTLHNLPRARDARGPKPGR